MVQWREVFQSGIVAREWAKYFGAFPTYCQTRWWSEWETWKVIWEHRGDLLTFIARRKRAKAATAGTPDNYGSSSPKWITRNDICPKSRDNLENMLRDANTSIKLFLEFAIAMDVGSSLVKATYLLEGDGALSMYAYSFLLKLEVALNTVKPRKYLDEFVAQLDPSHKTTAREYAEACVQPVTGPRHSSIVNSCANLFSRV